MPCRQANNRKSKGGGNAALKYIMFCKRAFIIVIITSLVLFSMRHNAEATAASLRFSELYESITVRGMKVSKKTQGLVGKKVVMKGFMAPPLKPDLKFFVLTRQPVNICPFCDSDADWPEDIVVVYLKGTLKYVQDGTPVQVEGILEVGTKIDKETGFLSRVRLVDAVVSKQR